MRLDVEMNPKFLVKVQFCPRFEKKNPPKTKKPKEIQTKSTCLWEEVIFPFIL